MLPYQRSARVVSPFDLLYDMRREVDRMLGDWQGSGPTADTPTATWHVPAEVLETEEELRFDLELPGVRIEDVDVTLENGILTIAGEKRFQRQNEEGDFRLFERRYGRFERTFRLPQNVIQDDVKASYADGVLTVRLPKTEESKPRRIQIEGAGESRRIEAGAAS